MRRFRELAYRYPWPWALAWGLLTVPLLLAVGANARTALLIGAMSFVVFGIVRSRQAKRR
jgi:hypothetical protein